ncbi:MAG: hypothetical protein HYZ63_03435 [Candidatus Andersenbacteria bacterium]|nr:hypothetical protein [Candidatus Andersenbacteria bacterium]
MAEMMAAKTKGKPAQDLIQISEIRDGVLLLADGTMRATLLVSSINFALKSEDEQNAIIYAYQDFINSLDFGVQISVSSRKLDITPYLEEVKALRDKQANELLRLQMNEYINFVGELVKGSNIMTKTFFITVPFAAVQNKKQGFFERIFKGVKAATGKHTMNDEEFEHNKSQLFQRVEQVALGLRGMGLRVVPLQTQELLELFYNLYNPMTSRNQRLQRVGQMNIEETSE